MLEAVERGEIQRLMVLMPPGSAKSTYTSVLFPPWFMGRNPAAAVLGVSNTSELAERFSRRARNVVGLSAYKNVFGFGVSESTKSVANWETERGGEFFAAGVGGAIAGRRADLGLIDDPIKSREEADSERVRQKQWDWYVNDFCTRLKPNARQIVIQCMTGDTKVLMEDGSEKELRHIRPGSRVATYENGKVCASTVLNWANQGVDKCFSIKTKSGIISKSNERHPFLVDRGGVLEWTKLRNLRAGDSLVRVIGGNGAELPVPFRDVNLLQRLAGIAIRIIEKLDGLTASVLHRPIRHRAAPRICGTDMGLTFTTMSDCWQNRAVIAPFADARPQITLGLIGAASYALIMIMYRVNRAASFAMTAIWRLVTVKPLKYLLKPLNTYVIGRDEITEISELPPEEVFDIEVAGTHNFIANGLVSHNTRWHEDDLGGRILDREAKDWTVIKIPMIATAGDPLGRAVGERLWPQWFTEEMVEKAKLDPRAWNALYQQDPAPEEGDFFTNEYGEYVNAPKTLHIYGASDYAVTDGGGDYTEHGIAGLDFNGDLYVLDWWREQAASNVWIERQCDLIAVHKPLIWFGETGPIRRAIEPYLRKRMEERETLCRLEWLPSISDKIMRARSIQARWSMGKVFLPMVAPWKADLVGQMLKFPGGKYDDGVDVMSLFGRGLEFVKTPKKKEAAQIVQQQIMPRRGPNAWMNT